MALARMRARPVGVVRAAWDTDAVAHTAKEAAAPGARVEALVARARARAVTRPPVEGEGQQCATHVFADGKNSHAVASALGRTGGFEVDLMDAFQLAGARVAALVLSAQHLRGGSYAELSGPSVRWTCAWRGGGADATWHNVSSRRVTPDLHKHTLVVACPVPEFALAGGRDAAGRLRHRLAVTASSGSGTLLTMAGIPICGSDEKLPPPPPDPPAAAAAAPPPALLAACTMITPARSYDTLQLAQIWVHYHLLNGVDEVTIYVDHPSPGFRQALQKKFEAEIQSGQVHVVHFYLARRKPFETQPVQQTHCLWRYKNVAQWVIETDIDEFMQPMGQHASLRDAAQVKSTPARCACHRLADWKQGRYAFCLGVAPEHTTRRPRRTPHAPTHPRSKMKAP